MRNIEKKKEQLIAFGNHLKAELSHKAFSALPDTLSVTLNRFGRLMRGKVDWTVEEIGKIAPLLDKDPLELIEEWEIGDQTLTLFEYKMILEERGYRIHHAVHAA